MPLARLAVDVAVMALVTSGPFALSSNPVHPGNMIAMTGAALALTRLAIDREAAHLAARFSAGSNTCSQRAVR